MNPRLVDTTAEQAVLAAALTSRELLPDLSTIVQAADFYDTRHAALWGQLEALGSGGDWDVTTLARNVRQAHGAEAGSAAVRMLMDLTSFPLVADASAHARVVAEKARGRRVLELLKIATAKAELGDTAEAIDLASQTSAVIAPTVTGKSMRELEHIAYKNAIAPISRAVLGTGNSEIDAMTGGIRPSFCWVLAGGTSEGKTSQLIAMVQDNLRRGIRCGIVSVEDGEELFGDRFLARDSGISANRIRDHRLLDTDHSRATNAISSADDSEMFLHLPGMPFERMAPIIDRFVLRNSIQLIALDYIQECTCEKEYATRALELQAIARKFRAIVRLRKCAGIICSQVTGYEQGKAPTKEMVRECKDIANGAEVVAILYSRTVDDKRTRCMNLDKVKNGRTGTIELQFDEETASFKRVLSADDETAEFCDTLYDDLDRM